MASQSTSGNIISNRYASALYDLASESTSVDQVLNDLGSLQYFTQQNKDLKLLIKSPLISSNDKLIIFEKILSKINAHKLTNTFLKVVSNNKRFSNLPSIIKKFISINSEKRGDILADVTSAENLTDEQKKGINEKLKLILGEKLSLNFAVDKNIIGGLIIKVGSKMIDTSLVSKINKLKISMKGA